MTVLCLWTLGPTRSGVGKFRFGEACEAHEAREARLNDKLFTLEIRWPGHCMLIAHNKLFHILNCELINI